MKIANTYEVRPNDPLQKGKQGFPKMSEQGVSLVELMVTMGIIAILALTAGFMYQGWMGGYKMEKITKELYTDLMNTRGLAVTRSRMYFVTLVDANNYSVTEDTNDSAVRGDTVGGISDAVLPTYPKRVEYALNWNAAVPVNRVFSIDKRGIMNVVGSDPFPVPDPIISLTTAADIDPDYNCIVISQTRIKMGKMTGGNCVER